MQTQTFPQSTANHTDMQWPHCKGISAIRVFHLFYGFPHSPPGTTGIAELPCWAGKGFESPSDFGLCLKADQFYIAHHQAENTPLSSLRSVPGEMMANVQNTIN